MSSDGKNLVGAYSYSQAAGLYFGGSLEGTVLQVCRILWFLIVVINRFPRTGQKRGERKIL
jgi:hypothetical protein